MIHDFRFAFRQLIKAPGFTFAAVLVLALGIGANTAVFSLVNTLFFAPPAYAKPHEMLQIFSQDKKDPKKFRGFSYPTYRDIREQNTVFSDAMAFNLALIGLGQKGDTRRTFAAVVSSNYFSVLGVPLTRGRAFLPEEETPGRNAPVAIVSYSYWQKHNLDPTVLGSQVLINGRPFTIVGITPKGFAGTLQILSPDVWLPISVYDQVANDFGSKDKTTMDDRNGTQLRIIARLKPGMTAAAAKPALEGLAANLEKAYPVEQKNQTFITAPVSRIAVSTNPAAARGGEIDRAVIARDGGGGPARGLPQSRKHVACAWHRAPEGNRDPPRAWRQPLADRASASQRRFCAGAARRRGWTRSWIVVVGSADWLNAQIHAFPDCVVDRGESRNFGRNVWILPARHTDVCARAGLKDLAQRGNHRFEGARRGRCGSTALEIFTAQPARRCATRVLARPPDRSRFVRARREQSRLRR